MTANYDWYKRNPKKFIRGVRGMGPDLIGAYAVILDLIYEDEDSCPNDPHWLGGILGCNSRKAAALVDGLIRRGKLYEEDGRLFNDKATSELEDRQKTRRRARDDAETLTRRDDAPAPANSKNKDIASTEKRREEKNRRDKRRKKVSAALSDATASSGSGSIPGVPSQGVVVISEPTELSQAVDAYNQAAERCPHKPNGNGNAGWARCDAVTANREKVIRARLKEVGLDGWRAAMARGAASDFLSGRSRRQAGRENWGVDIAWIAKAENFAKLLEGKYDNDRGRQTLVGRDSARAGLMEFMGAGGDDE